MKHINNASKSVKTVFNQALKNIYSRRSRFYSPTALEIQTEINKMEDDKNRISTKKKYAKI